MSLTYRFINALRLALISLTDPAPFILGGVRARIYRVAGAKVGAGACVFGRSMVTYPDRLQIGRRTFVNVGCTFENLENISIGDDSFIGPNVGFFTSNHDLRTLSLVCRPVIVGSRVWIGGGCKLLPGCEIADNSIIAAGTVMLGRSYKAGVYGGVPGRLLNVCSSEVLVTDGRDADLGDGN